MSKQTTQTRHKIRQFQWFEMQTKGRQIVQKLISPFLKRVIQTMDHVSSQQSFTIQQSKKLEQLKKVVTNDPTSQQLDILKTIDKKHSYLQIQISELRNQISLTQKVISRRFEIQDQREKQNQDLTMNNMKLKQRINEQIMEQNNMLKQFQEQVQCES